MTDTALETSVIPVQERHRFDVARLEDWLRAHVDSYRGELTVEQFQARVVGLLEASGKAMPGVGFLLGGAIAAILSPRASFLTAGLGVVAVCLVATPTLARARWGKERIPTSVPDEEVAPQGATVGPGP